LFCFWIPPTGFEEPSDVCHGDDGTVPTDSAKGSAGQTQAIPVLREHNIWLIVNSLIIGLQDS